MSNLRLMQRPMLRTRPGPMILVKGSSLKRRRLMIMVKGSSRNRGRRRSSKMMLDGDGV